MLYALCFGVVVNFRLSEFGFGRFKIHIAGSQPHIWFLFLQIIGLISWRIERIDRFIHPPRIGKNKILVFNVWELVQAAILENNIHYASKSNRLYEFAKSSVSQVKSLWGKWILDWWEKTTRTTSLQYVWAHIGKRKSRTKDYRAFKYCWKDDRHIANTRKNIRHHVRSFVTESVAHPCTIEYDSLNILINNHISQRYGCTYRRSNQETRDSPGERRCGGVGHNLCDWVWVVFLILLLMCLRETLSVSIGVQWLFLTVHVECFVKYVAGKYKSKFLISWGNKIWFLLKLIRQIGYTLINPP